jgi:hypothetical protein
MYKVCFYGGVIGQQRSPTRVQAPTPAQVQVNMALIEWCYYVPQNQQQLDIKLQAIADLLVTRHADPNFTTDYLNGSYSPLLGALSTGNIHVLRLLAVANELPALPNRPLVNLNARSLPNNQTALDYAFMQNKFAMVRQLMLMGARPNIKHVALALQKYNAAETDEEYRQIQDILKDLVHAGINVNYEYPSGTSELGEFSGQALEYAMEHVELATTFLKLGAFAENEHWVLVTETDKNGNLEHPEMLVKLFLADGCFLASSEEDCLEQFPAVQFNKEQREVLGDLYRAINDGLQRGSLPEIIWLTVGGEEIHIPRADFIALALIGYVRNNEYTAEENHYSGALPRQYKALFNLYQYGLGWHNFMPFIHNALMAIETEEQRATNPLGADHTRCQESRRQLLQNMQAAFASYEPQVMHTVEAVGQQALA